MSLFYSIFLLALGVTPSLLKGKDMKLILLLNFLGNFLVAFGYIMDGGVNGAAASVMGAVCTLINFCFEVKKKDIPKWLIAFYIVVTVVLNLWVSKGINLAMLLVIASGIIFHISTTRKSGKGYRFWIFFNLLIWCVYDLITHSYVVILTHGTQFVINVVGILIHDIKREN